jgi:ketosteroid isomerase-like protein
VSERNLRLARQGYEAWNRGDLAWFIEHLSDDVEAQPVRDLPGFENLYRGHDGWRRFWDAWRDSWSEIRIGVQRMQDMGKHGVLVLLTFEGVGRTSGSEVTITVSHWLKFRDGRLAGVTVLAPEAAERRREPRA